MRSIALDLWLSLKTGAICALEMWRTSRGERKMVSEPVRVEYRGFVEQADGTWLWEEDGADARIREYEPGKWSGSATRPGDRSPYVYVDFSSVEAIVDAIRGVVYGTDDGEPRKH